MIVPYPFQMECVDKVAKPTLAGRLVADDMEFGIDQDTFEQVGTTQDWASSLRPISARH